jgi:hypothetical protein
MDAILSGFSSSSLQKVEKQWLSLPKGGSHECLQGLSLPRINVQENRLSRRRECRVKINVRESSLDRHRDTNRK